MSTIHNVIEKSKSLATVIKNAGFNEAIIFKGFVDTEKHNLNLLVTDAGSSEDKSITSSLAVRLSRLKRVVNELLPCQIVITVNRGQ
jgi:hypothetical protein